MNVLVIDVGGSHVKLAVSSGEPPRRFDSGKGLTPETLVTRVRKETADWDYDCISLGYPGIVDLDEPGEEPGNLAEGWVGFDFDQAFGHPVRLVNDAVMQALGAYDGGRMLFLGLGTGLGSALVSEHVVVPLELGNLPAPRGGTMADCIGRKALNTNGRQRWVDDVHDIAGVLHPAFAADYLMLGGGNAELVDPLPAGTRRGGNEDAFAGGYRLWEEEVETPSRQPHRIWRVVQ